MSQQEETRRVSTPVENDGMSWPSKFYAIFLLNFFSLTK